MTRTSTYFALALGFTSLSFILPAPHSTVVHASGLAKKSKPSTIRFAGLGHSTTGAAVVHDRLVVNNIGSSGEDGVEIVLGSSRGWRAEGLRVVPETLDWTMTLRASGVRGRQPVRPSLALREFGSLATQKFFVGFAPAFGASTYRIEIYDDSSLVYSASDFSSGGEHVFSANDAICDFFGKSNSVALGICEWVASPGFEQNDEFECEWDLTGQRKMFFLEDGTEVMGNRIRFVENLSGAPQRASFRKMQIQASHLRSLTIDDEEVLRRNRREGR